MQQNTFTYDIETVPRNDLSEEVMQEVNDKTIASFQGRDYTEEEYQKQQLVLHCQYYLVLGGIFLPNKKI